MAFRFGKLEGVAIDLFEVIWIGGELLSDGIDILSLVGGGVVLFAPGRCASPARDEAVSLEFTDRGTL